MNTFMEQKNRLIDSFAFVVRGYILLKTYSFKLRFENFPTSRHRMKK